jgi:hypothetical protein
LSRSGASVFGGSAGAAADRAPPNGKERRAGGGLAVERGDPALSGERGPAIRGRTETTAAAAVARRRVRDRKTTGYFMLGKGPM